MPSLRSKKKRSGKGKGGTNDRWILDVTVRARQGDQSARFPLAGIALAIREPFVITEVNRKSHNDPMTAPMNNLVPASLRYDDNGKGEVIFALTNDRRSLCRVAVIGGEAARVLSYGYGRDVKLLPSGEIVSPHLNASSAIGGSGLPHSVPTAVVGKGTERKDIRTSSRRKSYRKALDFILERLLRSERQSEGRFFHAGNHLTGQWELLPEGDFSWTGGFWVGELWNAYSLTGDSHWLEMAQRWNAKLLGREHLQDHDAGFLSYCSSVKGYELTGEEIYKEGALAGADRLVEMFNPVTSLIPAWELNGSQTIVDTMMNLKLLWWAHEKTGRRMYEETGVRHARRTMELLIREDGSAHQSIHYDPLTGALKFWNTHQGYNPLSAWARGIAWALDGFTAAYRSTRRKEFLETAKSVANFVIGHLPEDCVPWYDYRDPGIVFTNKDTSAAAVNACGFLHLAEVAGSRVEAALYRDWGRKIIDNLIDRYLTPLSSSSRTPPGILRHGCYTRPACTELIWGDYYLMEALLYCVNHRMER